MTKTAEEIIHEQVEAAKKAGKEYQGRTSEYVQTHDDEIPTHENEKPEHRSEAPNTTPPSED